MRGDIPTLPKYVFTGLCLIKHTDKKKTWMTNKEVTTLISRDTDTGNLLA